MKPSHKIWQDSTQMWQELGPDQEEEGVLPVYVNNDLVPETQSVPRKGKKHAVPRAFRRMVT